MISKNEIQQMLLNSSENITKNFTRDSWIKLWSINTAVNSNEILPQISLKVVNRNSNFSVKRRNSEPFRKEKSMAASTAWHIKLCRGNNGSQNCNRSGRTLFEKSTELRHAYNSLRLEYSIQANEVLAESQTQSFWRDNREKKVKREIGFESLHMSR